MDRHATASEPAAMERSTAAPESTAMKPAAAEATTTAAAKTAASTTAETTSPAMTAMPDFSRQIVANFAEGAVPGLASESASARCCDAAANANRAAAVTPRRRTRPRPGSDIAMDESP
jgi:hypothetical protein